MNFFRCHHFPRFQTVNNPKVSRKKRHPKIHHQIFMYKEIRKSANHVIQVVVKLPLTMGSHILLHIYITEKKKKFLSLYPSGSSSPSLFFFGPFFFRTQDWNAPRQAADFVSSTVGGQGRWRNLPGNNRPCC